MSGLNTHDSKKMAAFEQVMQSLPEVTQCYLITGHTADYMLKVIAANLSDYQNFLLNKLTRIEGVNNVHSSFVLRKVVEKTDLPLRQLVI